MRAQPSVRGPGRGPLDALFLRRVALFEMLGPCSELSRGQCVSCVAVARPLFSGGLPFAALSHLGVDAAVIPERSNARLLHARPRPVSEERPIESPAYRGPRRG